MADDLHATDTVPMRITLIDDSIPFDGYTPVAYPLGGAEKAFASLAAALAGRGHEVTVINRCRMPTVIDGVRWETWTGRPKRDPEVVIAFRKVALLDTLRHTGRRILWLTSSGRALDRPAEREILETHRPALVFLGQTHRTTWSRPAWSGGPKVAVIPPGVREAYLGETPNEPATPPRAIVTTHPSHGLDWLLDLWTRRIHAEVPEAELHIYSAVLSKGLAGAEVPEAVRPVLRRVVAGRAQGVVVQAPGNDFDMAEAYRKARVHLYPGHPDDMGFWTLAESQAAGLPAVARTLGAAADRIVDGRTGYLVPDAEALANIAQMVLTSDRVFRSLSDEARSTQRSRTWDAVAAEFEGLWK
ncbi:MAG: glycosyltransferase [Alphaproteobacteria bacterium]